MANINKIIENADEAYYAADYEKAIRFYQQALEIDPDNEHARRQLKKAEINRRSKDVDIRDLPVEALQYYKRSRSFIRAGDLAEARKLLKRAIQSAEKAGVEFQDARQLVENLQNAEKASELTKKALEDIDLHNWLKAETNLSEALNLDPTDWAARTLLDHLKDLLKARQLVENLKNDNIRPVGRSAKLREIRKIIDITNQTTQLSILWQEVVTLLRQNTSSSYNSRIAMTSALIASFVFILVLWLLYLIPRNHVVVDCSSVSPGLKATVDYPAYIANGDKDVINLAFTNESSSVINGDAVISFGGSVNVRLVPPTKTSRIEFKDINPGEKNVAAIHFSVDEPFRLISNPGDYVEFSLCGTSADPNEFHIALAPIYALRTSFLILWGSVVFWVSKLFGDNIKSFVMNMFRKSENG